MRSSILILLALLFVYPVFSQTVDSTPDSLNSHIIPYVTLSAGLLVPNPEPNPGIDIGSYGLPIHIRLTATYGMRVNERAGVGLGSGLIILDRGMVLPLFFELRGDFLKKDITPTWYTQMGSVIPLYSAESGEDWWGNPVYEDFEAKGGLLFDVGFGIKVKNNEKSATTLSIGFQTMNITEAYSAWGTKYKNSYQFQRLSIQGGWMF